MKVDDNEQLLEYMGDEMDKLFNKNIYKNVLNFLIPHHKTVIDVVWSN